MSAIRILLVSGIMLFSSGCFLGGKKPAVVAPVTAPVTPAPTPASAPAPQQRPAPPPTPAAAAPAPPQPRPAPATEPAKPSPFPPVSAGTAPKPAPASPTPTPALGTLLTADQRKQLDTAYQSDLRQANAVLARLSGRTLTAEQASTASRARDFIRQAAQFHDRDLTTAAELARRARVLTQDLAGALK